MEKLFLLELREDINKFDALQLIKWLNDEDVTHFMNESNLMAEQIKSILANRQEVLLTYFLNQKCHFYVIDYNSAPIGFISLIPNVDKKYEIVIAVGEKGKWGQKIGHYSLKKAISEVKTKYKGKELIAKIDKENERSIGLFEHMGFSLEKEGNRYFNYKMSL